MTWRLWALLASAPLGLPAALALPGETGPGAVAALVGIAGLLGVGLASLAARLGDDAPDRPAHVARGASVGFAALPVAAAAAARLGPPAWLWLLLAVGGVALALWRASRVQGPGPTPTAIALAAFGAAALGSLAVVAAALGYGLLPTRPVAADANLRAASWDIDSRVAQAPDPGCAPEIESVEVLVERGSAPRLAADGETVWFEARGEDGRFQVYRLRPGGPARCWSCDEPGNNRRPAPHPRGQSVLFDSDRFATWRDPDDTEVMVTVGLGEEKPRHPSRRLTYRPGPDDHALYDPSGTGFVWSSGTSGRFEVLRASVQSGHGGLLLSHLLPLATARAAWIVPLAWAPDARTLVLARGQPLAPLVGQRIDPATGAHEALGAGLVAGSVSFSADGRRMAVASTVASGVTRLVPALLGNVVARWPDLPEPGVEGTRVAIGEVGARLEPVALGPVARWGAPTGVALAPDARSFVLGQRGDEGERIIRVALACRD